MTSTPKDAAAIEASFRDVYRAMLAADTSALDHLLAPEFTLTHITGFVQSRREWLADVDSRRMAYHSAQEVSITLRDTGRDSASLTARHVVDATIWGGRGRWNLQLAADMVLRDGRWLVAQMVATISR